MFTLSLLMLTITQKRETYSKLMANLREAYGKLYMTLYLTNYLTKNMTENRDVANLKIVFDGYQKMLFHKWYDKQLILYQSNIWKIKNLI